MKNRRIAIIAFVLVAVMAIGVGYAALTDVVTINGTANAGINDDEFNNEVLFTSAVVTSQTVNGVSSTPGTGTGTGVTAQIADGDDVTITVTTEAFKTLNDKVLVTIVLTNNSDVNATLKSVTVNEGDTEYFGVTILNTSEDPDAQPANDQPIAANGGTITFTVEIELIKTPTDDVNTSFSVSATVTAG